MPRVVRSALRFLRNLRWRTLRWSASADRQYHDAAFLELSHDPFSPAYVGSITIRRFADLASAAIQDGTLVLDLGCGPGEITCELARRRPAVTFIGVDHSRQAIDVARGHASRLGLDNVEFVAGDVSSYAPPARAKLVMMFNAFHHLIDPAAFVARFRSLTDDFLLIEPIGDSLGRWRESLDFDWAAAELDKIRARLDHGFQAPAMPPRAAGAEDAGGEPVEHRYTLDDFESFFDGFSLAVRGTVSGLNAYPPHVELQTDWRRRFGEIARAVYESIDDRLLADNRDLWGRHWVVHATPGPRLARREPRPFAGAGAPAQPVAGPYDVIYAPYEGPTEAPASAEILTEIGVRNTGYRRWSSEEDTPVFVSYRWLSRAGVPVAMEGRRSRLPHPLDPGAGCPVPLVIETPAAEGRYVLSIELVHEGVTWFSEAGQLPCRVAFRVTKRLTP